MVIAVSVWSATANSIDCLLFSYNYFQAP